MNDTQSVLTSRRWLVWLVWLVILGFGLAIVGDSLAQRRGAWGGGYSSPSYTYRPAPPRPMTPAPRPMNPTPRPMAPTMTPQKGYVPAQVGKSTPTTPGGTGTRALPAKLATAPIAQVPSYTGRITTKGAPIIVTKTGVPYSISGKGMFSTKTVSTFRMVRTDRVRVFADGKVIKLQSRIAKVSLRQRILEAKVPESHLPSERKQPYSPRETRKGLEEKYGESVRSTTVPPLNKPNVKLANQEKWVSKKNGERVRIIFDSRGFPIFDGIAKYDTRFISREFSESGYRGQMKMASRDLKSAIERGAVRRKDFNDEQLLAINRGAEKIPGYTWHHHQDSGRMQLIPEDVHSKVRHIGGEAMAEGR